MYSHADRIRAVELYIQLGKRVKATIRQLGYPTKNALRNWYREYQQLNSPEFRRHPQVRFSAAFRTRRATASRF